MTAALTSCISGVLLTDQATMESFRFWQVGTVGGRGLRRAAPGPAVPRPRRAARGGREPGARLASPSATTWPRGWAAIPPATAPSPVSAVVLLAGGRAARWPGPIAFVGLVVPHAARIVTGPAHRRLLPLSAAYGAALVVLADTAGRVVLPPTEVQVGIMTAVVGVPVFMALVRRSRLGAL